MRIVLLLIFFSLVVRDACSQTLDWAWAKSGGTVSIDYSNGTYTDVSGNVYLTGTFQGSTITFGSFVLHNTATGNLDIFTVKYDAAGNVLWAKSAGGVEDDYAFGICADVNGNVYITGSFRSDTITFGASTLTNVQIPYRDIFLAKYDSSGSEIWAKCAGSSADDLSWGGICSDANNNIYITGAYGYSSPIIFGSYTLATRGNYDAFIAKYDTTGNILWAKSIGGTQSDGALSICSDANNNIYVTGYFSHEAVFGNDTVIGNGGVTVFVARYDSDGSKIWAKSARGLWLNCSGIGYGVKADRYGYVYVTGYFQYDICFGDTLSNAGNSSIFLSKYDSNGNVQWGRTPGGTVTDNGSSLCTDINGNVFIAGYFSSPFLNFGGFPVINTNPGYNDMFVAEYDANGNALWATGVGGQGNDFGMSISSSQSSDVYVAGYFDSYSLNFGNTTVVNNGSHDFFLARLSTDSISTGIERNGSSVWSAFPNPFSTQLTFSLSDNLPTTVTVYDFLGQQLLQQTFTNSTTINTEQMQNGIYFYELRSNKGSVKTGKVVKQ